MPATPLMGSPDGLLRLLLRRKLVLTLAALAGLALGIGAARFMPERYTAEGLLVVDSTGLTIPELSALASNRQGEALSGRSEARILTTNEIVAAAVDRLRLIDDPLFNPTLTPPRLAGLTGASWLPANARTLLERFVPAAAKHHPAKGAAERSAIIRELQQRLAASAEDGSYTIALAYQGPTAETAAAVVNAVMQVYVARNQVAKQAELAEARGELERRLAQLGGDLAAARQTLGRLEAETGLVVGDGGTISARTLDALLGEAQSLRIEQERILADLDRVAAALAGGAEGVLRGTLVTPRLEQLWIAQAALQKDLAEAGQTLGPRHPQIMELEAQARLVARDADREVRNIGQSLERETLLLAEREKRLAALIEEAEAAAASTAGSRVDIELARQEMQSLQSLHDLYRERYEQTLLSPTLIVGPDARIASLAEPPIRPDGPGRLAMGGLGAALGLLLAAGLIVARSRLGDGLNRPDDIRRSTGLPVLGVLPTVSRRGGALADAVARAPEGPATESLRAVLAHLKAPHRPTMAQTLLVTSSVSGDGKTAFSLAAARVAAREGLRCLVVEGDYKRPGLRRALGAAAKAPGMPVDVAGQTGGAGRQLPYTILTDEAGGAHVLVVETMADLAPSLLRSERLRLLFANARTYYDLIIIDGPPLLATADSLLLAEHADTVVLIAAAGSTTGSQLGLAAGRLAQIGCPVAGVVLNRCGGRQASGHAFTGYARRRPKPFAG